MFLKQTGLSRADALQLIALAHRAFRWGEKATGSKWAGRLEAEATTAFNEAAHRLGFDVVWPGLWPLLRRDGHDYHLPESLP